MKNNEVIKALNDIDELFKNRRIIKKNNSSIGNVPVDINLKIIRNKKHLETAYGAYDEVRKEIMSQIEDIDAEKINTENMAGLTAEERERVKSANRQMADLLAAENSVSLEMIGESDAQRSNLDVEELAALSFMLNFTSPETTEETDETRQIR